MTLQRCIQIPVRNLKRSSFLIKNLSKFPVITLSFPRKESRRLLLLKCLKEKDQCQTLHVVSATNGTEHNPKYED